MTEISAQALWAAKCYIQIQAPMLQQLCANACMQLIMMSEVCAMHMQGTHDHNTHDRLQEKKKKKHKEKSSALPGGKSGTAICQPAT